MSSNQIVLQANNLGKAYRLYAHPQDRLKHTLFWRFGREYGQVFWALRHVSFELQQGEMLGVIGRNGSGKSTLLQLLAGTLNPTEGTLQTYGRVTALLELGSGFNFEFSGRENIYLNASVLGLSPSETETKIEDIIAFADIGEFIDQPVKLYSSGMFVRLAFAVTTGLDPDILLVDEALAVGDIFFRQKCHQRLRELRSLGTAIIYVTHNMPEVEQLCDRAILLNHGQVLERGEAMDVVKKFYIHQQSDRSSDLDQPTWSTPVPVMTEIPMHADFRWPEAASFSTVKLEKQISDGRANLTGFAVFDDSFKPRTNFQWGETVHFYYEFETFAPLNVPLGGIVLTNQFGVHVHGKNGLNFGTSLPYRVEKGVRLRFHQQITLNINAGEYSFELGLAEISPGLYEKRSYLPYPVLREGINRICHVPEAAGLSISHRLQGTPAAFMHYGICDLPGAMDVDVVTSR